MNFTIKGISITELEEFITQNGFPKYRAHQIYNWLYKQGVLDIQDMNNLSNDLKSFLTDNTIVSTLTLFKQVTCDNTIKFLFKTKTDQYIESVSMIEDDKHTICLSSQVGCSVDCDFCATGKMGFVSNLNTGEIIDQLLFIQNNVKQPITNIVFMGMGEPFLNYNNVIKSCKILNDTNGFNLSSKRITISTSGILPKIKQFINEKHKYKLAISLNASNNKTRDKLIPINKKWPIETILNSIQKYPYKKYRPIMFEYILIKDINDSIENAIELSNLLKNINCKINIIPYNETGNDYKRSNKIDTFVSELTKKNNNYRVLVRWSKGQDIDAACGQLATKNE